MNVCTNACMHAQTYAHQGTHKNGWMDGWMDASIRTYTDQHCPGMHPSVHTQINIVLAHPQTHMHASTPGINIFAAHDCLEYNVTRRQEGKRVVLYDALLCVRARGRVWLDVCVRVFACVHVCVCVCECATCRDLLYDAHHLFAGHGHRCFELLVRVRSF